MIKAALCHKDGFIEQFQIKEALQEVFIPVDGPADVMDTKAFRLESVKGRLAFYTEAR